MGYTKFTTDLISRHIEGVKSVLDLGSQNLYTGNEPNPPFVSEWYKSKGITNYVCIDLAGDNNALKLDLSEVLPTPVKFDLVVDAGTSEHCVQMNEYETVSFHEGYINSIYPKGEVKNIDLGYYNCWLNKHNLCKVGGLIISENPESKSWPLHGYTYLNMLFYYLLCEYCDYKILEIGRNAALGNEVDGWNVHCVIKKTGNKFIDFEEFKKLPYCDK